MFGIETRKAFSQTAYRETRRMQQEITMLENLATYLSTEKGKREFADESFRDSFVALRIPYQDRVENDPRVARHVPASYIGRYHGLVDEVNQKLFGKPSIKHSFKFAYAA